MIDLKQRMAAFAELGKQLLDTRSAKFQHLVSDAVHYNGWFTADMVDYMLKSIGESLRIEKLNRWLEPYSSDIVSQESNKTIGVVMAGNIPAVGFHDFLSVLITGNRLKAKLSTDDQKILPGITKALIDIEPALTDFIEFTDNRLENFDAIIATGSTNTSRYFDYYFGKYPNIIRKNRNAVAVLDGNENDTDLEGLADDIFLYYGLGCRSISKLFLPDKYDFQPLLTTLSNRKKIAENHKYLNNYEYNKAIFLVNGTEFLDAGNLLLVEDEGITSPVSVIYYSSYSKENIVNDLQKSENELQCVISRAGIPPGTVPFGKSQQPELWDYADGIDTLKFILSIN
jgi:hypothetical protein